MTQTKTATACGLCGANGTALLQHGVRNRPDMDVVRCEGCGLVQLAPLPTEEQLRAYYSDSYREAHEPGLDPAGAYRTELPEARTRVERLAPLLTPRTALLELGASSGAFIDSARPFVGSVCGAEPSVKHREWAKSTLGLDMVADMADLGERRFDAIVLFHVLEHVRRPDQFLGRLAGLLRPGGFIGVEVPNVEDALLSVYKVPAFGPHYYQDAHLWYFSGKTLGGTFAAAGLEPETLWLQRYDLSNHMCWLSEGKPGGKGAYRELLGAATEAAYAEALCRARASDTLWTVARRPNRENK